MTLVEIYLQQDGGVVDDSGYMQGSVTARASTLCDSLHQDGIIVNECGYMQGSGSEGCYGQAGWARPGQGPQGRSGQG